MSFILRLGIICLSHSFEKGVTFNLEKLTFVVSLTVRNESIGPLHSIILVLALRPVKLAFEAVNLQGGSSFLELRLCFSQFLRTIIFLDQALIKILGINFLAFISLHGGIRIVVDHGRRLHVFSRFHEPFVVFFEFWADEAVIELGVHFKHIINFLI